MLIEDQDTRKKVVAILDKIPRHRKADSGYWEHLWRFLFQFSRTLSVEARDRGGFSCITPDLSTDKGVVEILVDFNPRINDNSPFWRIEGKVDAKEIMIEYHDGSWPNVPLQSKIPVERATEEVLTSSLVRWLDKVVSIHPESTNRWQQLRQLVV